MSPGFESIHIKPDLLRQSENLTQFLEDLYLKGGRYELKFHVNDLQMMEQAFDRIIAKHGVRACNFIYNVES